jgi:hypothetical protein
MAVAFGKPVLFVNGDYDQICTITGNSQGDPMRAACADLTVTSALRPLAATGTQGRPQSSHPYLAKDQRPLMAAGWMRQAAAHASAGSGRDSFTAVGRRPTRF